MVVCGVVTSYTSVRAYGVTHFKQPPPLFDQKMVILVGYITLINIDSLFEKIFHII